MPASIEAWIKIKIAMDNDIGEGTVGSIANYFKIGLDQSEFDSARELALQAKKQGLNLSDLAANFRLHNFIKTSGNSEDQIESFITNISSIELAPEKVIDIVNQLHEISKSESVSPAQLSSYIEQKSEVKQRFDREIQRDNDVLQSKNVTVEAINEHIKLNEKLKEHDLSTGDIYKLLTLLSAAKKWV